MAVRDSPMIKDFSKEAVAKVVRDDILKKPITLYPLAIGVIGILAIALFGLSFITLLLTVGGLGLGIGSWAMNNFFKREALEGRYIKELYEALAQNRQKALESLEEELKDCEDIKGAEGFAEQGARQFEMVQREFENLRHLLDTKLNAGELSHMRFVGTAEQVCIAVLDNLKYVAAIIRSISAIDEEYINSRLKELAKLKNPADADKKEIETLNERKRLREAQLAKVNILLTENEEALTQINQASVAIADMKLDKGEALADLELARKDLSDLVLSRRKLNYNRT